jgi:predicted RNA-binding Zn ribbon-like protein
MPPQTSTPKLIGSRLAVDFLNYASPGEPLSWGRLIQFMVAAGIVSHDRGAQLFALPESDPTSAEQLLRKAQRLSVALRLIFSAIVRRQKLAPGWAEPLNEVLRITEGHDELVQQSGLWKIEFVAREGGLEWLLAAIARSAAEIITEGTHAPLKLCANPACGLFFYDDSRTHRRRWCSMAVCGNRSKVAAFARRHSVSHNSPTA